MDQFIKKSIQTPNSSSNSNMVVNAFVPTTSAPSAEYQVWRHVITTELDLQFLKRRLTEEYDDPASFVDQLCLMERALMFYNSNTSLDDVEPYFKEAYTDTVIYVNAALLTFDRSRCSDEDQTYIERWDQMFALVS